MKITRVWAMPDKRTFQIKPIKEIIGKYSKDITWLDLFKFPFEKDACNILKEKKDNSVQGVLFDPPYSPRQLKECYKDIGQSLHDTTSKVWSIWKQEIARVIEPGGICISFGWNSGGLGKGLGFEIIEILLVPHGGNHNDTIITIERKVNQTLKTTTGANF